MNYSLKTQYESVKYYLAEKNNIVIFYKKHNLVLNNNFIGKSNGHFFLMEDELFYSEEGKDTTTTILNIKTKNLEEVNTILMKNTLYDNTFLQSTDLQIDEKYNYSAKISVFQFKPAKKLYDLPNRYTDHQHLRIGNFLITEKPKNTLRSLSLLTGEYEWELDLGGRKYLDDSQQEKIAQITQIISIWENQLLVVMDSGELISIDIHVGQILWSKADIYTRHWDKIGFPCLSLTDWRNRSQFWLNYWHLEDGYLHNLDGNVYYRISLETQALEILWQDDLQKESCLTFVHKTYTEDYIYFTGSYNHQLSPYLLGVFNRKTLQVDWLYDFGNQLVNDKDYYAHSLNQAPQVGENKLYVLDSGGTLHIFECEG